MRRLLSTLLLALALDVHAMVGVNDPDSANALDRLNQQAALLRKLDYVSAAKNLQQKLSELESNLYAKSRILNELAELLTNRILNIEAAVEIDRKLLEISIPDTDNGQGSMLYRPKHLAAINRLLLDKDHFAEFIAIDSESIKNRARDRLDANQLLLNGQVRPRNNSYTKIFLDGVLNQVRSDINATHPGTTDRKRFLSRLIRVDYELLKLSGRSTGAYESFQTGELRIEDVDFGELTFLELSEYFTQVFGITGNIQFAELALGSVYMPYTGFTDARTRWKYNKLINSYISTLIEANFKAGRFDEVLYYANLNKSRMLLEERLTFGAGKAGNARISDLVADDGIPRTASGLPDKAWFKAKLAGTPQFLDFYVGGTYVADSGSSGSKAARAERSVMPLSSRNSGRVSAASEPTEVFKDDALYITQVVGGQATAVKVTGPELAALRREMEKSYAAISETQKVTASPTLQTLKSRLRLADTLTVSPDKWVSTHPLDFHLQARTVRSVNFFTSGASGKLGQLAVAGFFNPTLDLKGADAEADTIKALMPQASIIRREAARKSALASASAANIIHLSMHGNFNDSDPTLSKLVFAGAANDDSTGDPNALYATEMATVPTLRNRDLVFAAACQTGLQAADRTNTSELTGILRPLTANRNKNLILSLWNVSDQATGEFVKAFYQRLAATQDVKDAFHHAQDQLRAKYPHPYYWAAFYLSQAS